MTALSLISTIYKSQQHPLSHFLPVVFTSSSLVTAANCGDSSASIVTPLPAAYHSVNELNHQAWGPSYIASGQTQQIHRLQQFFYRYYGRLLNDSPDVSAGSCLTSRYQATNFLLAIVA
jgi:hypothetical protein